MYACIDNHINVIKILLALGYDYIDLIENEYVKNHVNIINEFILNKEYITIKNMLFSPMAANIFYSIVLLSDDYLNIKEC